MHEGKKGNPILFSNFFFSDLKKLNGDKGAKYFIKEYQQYIKFIKVSNTNIFEDIDDIKAYKNLLDNE